MLRRRLRPRRRQTRLLKVRRLLLAVAIVIGVILFAIFFHRYQLRRQSASLQTRAQEAAAREDHGAANDWYKQYLRFHPNDVEALAGQAASLEVLTRTDSRNYGDLVRAYETLLTINPTRQVERRQLAMIYMKLGHHGHARRHFAFLTDTRLGISQTDPELFVWMARGYWTERKWEEATTAFHNAIETGHAKLTTYVEFATMLREVGSAAAAVEADQVMAKLIASHPQDVEVRLMRAAYRTKHGDRRGAREDVEFTYRQLPGGKENLDVALLYAEYLVAEGAFPAAQTVLEVAAKAHPTNTALTLGLAEVQTRTNDSTGASKRLVAAAVAMPDGDVRLFDIADRLIDLGDRTAAKGLVLRLGTSPSVSHVVGYLNGRLAAADGDWPKAIAKLIEALPAMQQRHTIFGVKTHLELARCYGLASNPDRQEEAYLAALKLDPDSKPPRLGLAESLARLGRLDEAATLYHELAATTPAARLQLVRIRFAQALARPEADRNWAAFDLAIEAKPLPVEAEILRATSLYFRKRAAEAIAALQVVVAKPAAPPTAWSTLALLQGMQGGNDGFATLDKGDRAIGPSADLRLARAYLLARDPKKVPEIIALGTSLAGLSGDDAYRLSFSLGQVLAAMNRPQDAIPLLDRATTLAPFDVVSRSMLVELAQRIANEPLRLKMLEQLRVIDGDSGPSYVAASVGSEMAATPRPNGAQLAGWESRLKSAFEKRKQWGRLAVLLGDVAMLANRPDDAVVFFRRAIEQGERAESLVQKTVRLLMQRHAETEALALLASAANAGTLSEDMQKEWESWKKASQEHQDISLRWASAPDVAKSANSQDHLARARVFITHGLMTDAHAAIATAMTADPNDPDVYVMIVRFLMLTREVEAAKRWADKARKLFDDPKTPRTGDICRVPLALATIAELTGNQAEADRRYEAALKLRPHDLDIYQRWYASRQADKAAELLVEVERSDNVELARWAKRTRALEMVDRPEQYRNLPAAISLIEANLASGKPAIEDTRVRFYLDALSEFDRASAINKYEASATRGALTPEELYRLARIECLIGKTEPAIAALVEATRIPARSVPEHLALLARLQITRGDRVAARQTVGRLKLQAPNTWLAVAEEARLLAASGDRAGALKVLLDCPALASPEAKRKLVGPHLEAIGCLAEAETLYKTWMTEADTRKQSNAHQPLAELYIHTGRAPLGVELARSRQSTAPAGVTARLLSAAVRARPLSLLPEADQPLWRTEILKSESWVKKKREELPNDPDLLFASAELAEAAGNHDDAIAYYEAALPKADSTLKQTIRRDLARLLALHKKDGVRSLVLVNDAIADLGPLPDLLDARALALLTDGQTAEALRDIEAAIAEQPKPYFNYHRAVILHRLDRNAPRRAAFEEATKAGLTQANVHPLEREEFERLKADR